MALLTLREILDTEGGVPAFDIFDSNMLEGVLQAALELKSPVIIMAYEGHMKLFGLNTVKTFTAMMRAKAENLPIPVTIHLDHGKDVGFIKECICAGFSSVMFDGSMLPFEENLKITRELAEMAHTHFVSIEAEVGKVGSDTEGVETIYTSPDDAVRFAKDTGIDALAVSVGTTHGVYLREPRINLELTSEIQKALTDNELSVKLVLHGGSGTSPKSLIELVKRGIKKVNIGTDLNKAYLGILSSIDTIYLEDAFPKAIDAVKETAKKYIEIIRYQKEVTV